MAKIMQEEGAQNVLKHFMELLNALMQEGSGKFMHLTPSVISICRDIIYPEIRNITNPTTYFTLLHSILHFNWNLYFGSKSNQQMMKDFTFIIQCYYESFQTTDVTLFRKNLGSLESLNTTRQLYSRYVCLFCLFY